MNPSAQSQAILDDLLAGRTVSSTDSSVSLAPLSTPASVLLRVLVPQFEDLDGRSGEDQITALTGQYVRERDAAKESKDTGANGSPAGSVVVTEESDRAVSTAPAWRVASLRCSSIRGVTLPGGEFKFDLDAESALLFGPNLHC